MERGTMASAMVEGQREALFARLCAGYVSAWRRVGTCARLSGELRATLEGEGRVLEPAWAARSADRAYQRVEFGVLVRGRVVVVATAPLTSHVCRAVRDRMPADPKRHLRGGGPAPVRSRWPAFRREAAGSR